MARYHIHLMPDAIADLDRLRKYDATMILDGIEDFLRYEPVQISRSRIKRLRGRPAPDYRLRINDYRVFYRIKGKQVSVLRVLHKEQASLFYEGDIL